MSDFVLNNVGNGTSDKSAINKEKADGLYYSN